MANELEVKAVVEQPAQVRAALLAAGARCTFRGLLRDRRLDAAGRLAGLDEVLRVRRWIPDQGPERAQLAWKGPTTVSPEGYKQREEIEFVVEDGGLAMRLFESLGFLVTHAIDRAVEVYALDDAVARLEWYPRMDVLLEIEGPAERIRHLIAVTGLHREDCLPDSLAAFAARYAARVGHEAVLDEAALHGAEPSWSRR